MVTTLISSNRRRELSRPRAAGRIDCTLVNVCISDWESLSELVYLCTVYRDGLIHLNFPSLKYRRLRGDMIEVFKITHTIYDETFTPHLPSHTHGLILEAITTNSLISPFITIYASIFSLRVLLIFGKFA